MVAQMDPDTSSWKRQSKRAKNKVRSVLRKLRRVAVRTFLSYDTPQLVGDSLMMHSAFEDHHGYRGSVDDLLDAFKEIVGPDGNLLMVSLPYRSSSLEYLSKGKPFNVRKTPSAMGLVSEHFRRLEGVLRSANPSHPILALGPKAAWIVEGHEHRHHPCGPETPFEKLFQIGGKVAFLNVPFTTFTFFHYLEYVVSAKLTFPLYHDVPFDVPVVDAAGKTLTVRTFVFSNDALRRRRIELLIGWLTERGMLHKTRVGASHLQMVDLREVVGVVKDMASRGKLFYDMS
jgi:aminoglycoside 3-N-acetyltransferase